MMIDTLYAKLQQNELFVNNQLAEMSDYHGNFEIQSGFMCEKLR